MEGEGLGVLDHSSSRLFGHASPVLEHQTQQGRIAHTPRKLWRWYNKAWAPMHQLLTNPSRPGSRPDRTPSGVFWIRRTLDYRMSPMVHGSTASMGPIANPRIIISYHYVHLPQGYAVPWTLELPRTLRFPLGEKRHRRMWETRGPTEGEELPHSHLTPVPRGATPDHHRLGLSAIANRRPATSGFQRVNRQYSVFGLWRVCFPPVLIRTARRLPSVLEHSPMYRVLEAPARAWQYLKNTDLRSEFSFSTAGKIFPPTSSNAASPTIQEWLYLLRTGRPRRSHTAS